MVVEVVSPGNRPVSEVKRPGGARKHESYVVLVKSGKSSERWYWPRVSGLVLTVKR